METEKGQTADKPKTKMIIVDGTRRRVPVELYPIEDVIARGTFLQKQIDRLTEELKTVKDQALSIASERLGGKQSITLTGIAGAVEVRLNPDEIKADEDQAYALRGLLGEQFDIYFEEKREYRANKKGREFCSNDSVDLKAVKSNLKIRQVPSSVRFRYTEA